MDGIMKTFKISVEWKNFGVVQVSAETLEQAVKFADEDDTLPLPDEQVYVDGSWKVNDDMNLQKVLNN